MTGSTGSTRAGGVVLGDRYELLHHLARGGMADVFEATDRQLGRRVAVKRFRGASPQDRPRFDAEVLVLARLNHPNLVQVYDAGEHDGDGFVVMELVDGPSLQAVLQTRVALPARAVAALGTSLADALSYVHEQGIVHRDVTPANVLCGSDGRPRLADFGIARLIDTSRITAAATTIGTAAYMAPEQLEGHDVMAAADVYSLGLVLLEALAGRPGFEGTSAEAAVARLARDPDTTTGVPAPWAALLTDMTARDPSARPSAPAVRERLSELGSAGAPAEPPVIGAVDGPTVDLADGLDGPTVPVAAGVGVVGAAPTDEAVEVDGWAETRAVPVASGAAVPIAEGGAVAAPGGGGTAVMPVPLRPEAAAGAAPGTRAGRSPSAARPRHVLWGLAAGLVAALLIGLIAGSGGGIEVPATTTLEPVAEAAPSTTTTLAPTTTAPPEPAAPAVEPGAGRNGKGKGNGRGDDDD